MMSEITLPTELHSKASVSFDQSDGGAVPITGNRIGSVYFDPLKAHRFVKAIG